MSDKCVACGEVAEGKPLYKKLGSSDCQVEVFTALLEMELLSLPPEEKNNHYICWDCDETIAEEYATFLTTEAKKKAVEAKRKQQDEARKIKLQRKLKQAFKKAHDEALRASGVLPPVSKYKMKEKQREEDRYHATICLLCKSSFETSKAKEYQRFTLQKMVDDECDIAGALQKLGVKLDIQQDQKRKRFVCSQCYNKMRRNYKALVKGEMNFSGPKNLLTSAIPQTPEQIGEVFQRRPTAEEHAAEIAKLIPPSLANLYKVVTEEDGSKAPFLNKSPQSKMSSKKLKKKRRSSSSTSSSSRSTSSTTSSSSSTSPSSSSDSNRESSKPSFSPKQKKMIEKRRRSRNNDSKPPAKSNGPLMAVHSTTELPKTPTIRTLHPKGSNELSSCATDTMLPSAFTSNNSAIVDFGICNLCGLGYNGRPKDFWFTLNHLMPSVVGVTVLNALQILDSELADVSESVREKELVCKPCFSRVCKGFRSQILQRIAEKKGIDVDRLGVSKIKVKMMSGNLTDKSNAKIVNDKKEIKKVNGALSNNSNNNSKNNKMNLSRKERKRSRERKHKDDISINQNGAWFLSEKKNRTEREKKSSSELEKDHKRPPASEVENESKKQVHKGRSTEVEKESKKQDHKRSGTEVEKESKMQDHEGPGKETEKESKKQLLQSPIKSCDFSRRLKNQEANFKFKRRHKSSARKMSSIHQDLRLIRLINESHHLRYKGKVVLVNSVHVDLAELRGILPHEAYSLNNPIRLELFKEIYQFSNFHRNLKNTTKWSNCIICQKEGLGIKETTRWLDDPVAPPNLMVPLRWAQLSIGDPKSQLSVNLATEDGKVCGPCHANLKENFGKFVGTRVAMSHGLSSEKVVLNKYKVSFDSVAMNIVADPLDSPSPAKELKKHKKTSDKEENSADKDNNELQKPHVDHLEADLSSHKNESVDALSKKDGVSEEVTQVAEELNATGVDQEKRDEMSTQKDHISKDDYSVESGNNKLDVNANATASNSYDKEKNVVYADSIISGSPNSEKTEETQAQLTKSTNLEANAHDESHQDNVSMDLRLSDTSDSEIENEQTSEPRNPNSVLESSDEPPKKTEAEIPVAALESSDRSQRNLDVGQLSAVTKVDSEEHKEEEITDDKTYEEGVTENVVEETKVQESKESSEEVATKQREQPCKEKKSISKEDDYQITDKEEKSDDKSIDKEKSVHKIPASELSDKQASKKCKADIDNSEKEKKSEDNERSDSASVTESSSSDISKSSIDSNHLQNEDESSDSPVHLDSSVDTSSLLINGSVPNLAGNSSPNASNKFDPLPQNNETKNLSSNLDLVENVETKSVRETALSYNTIISQPDRNEDRSIEVSKENSESTLFSKGKSEANSLTNESLESKSVKTKQSSHPLKNLSLVLATGSLEKTSTSVKDSTSYSSISSTDETSFTAHKTSLHIKPGSVGEPDATVNSSTEQGPNKEAEKDSLDESNLDDNVKETSKKPSEIVDAEESLHFTSVNLPSDETSQKKRKSLEDECMEEDVFKPKSLKSSEDLSQSKQIEPPLKLKATPDRPHFARKSTFSKEKVLAIKRKIGGGLSPRSTFSPKSSFIASFSQSHNGSSNFLSALDEKDEENNYDEDSVAPFAQRKRFKGRTMPVDNATTTENQATQNSFEEIWQTIQSISLDDLITGYTDNPLRLSQYTTGVLLALNDLRVRLGASLEDLILWLKRLLPVEFRDKGLEPSMEKFSMYLFSLNNPTEELTSKVLKEVLPEDLFYCTRSLQVRLKQDKKQSCQMFLKDNFDETYREKSTESLKWEDFLAPVNIDTLIRGEPCRVSWNDFNNGLLYALWKVNKMFKGDESNFIKWLSLTSTTVMKEKDYVAMAKAATAINEHLQNYPEEIDRLTAPIVIRSNSGNRGGESANESKQSSGSDTQQSNLFSDKEFPTCDEDVILEKEVISSNPKPSPIVSVAAFAMVEKMRNTADRFPQSLTDCSTSDKQKTILIESVQGGQEVLCSDEQSSLRTLSPSVSSPTFQMQSSQPPFIPAVNVAQSIPNDNTMNAISNITISNPRSLQTVSQPSNLISLGNISYTNPPVSVPRMAFKPAFPTFPNTIPVSAGVPMIPILSSAGLMTMVPLSVRMPNIVNTTNYPNTNIINTQIQLRETAEQHAFLPSQRCVNPVRDVCSADQPPANRSDQGLASKISILERQLQEIQKQNSKLLEMNQKLLQKTLNDRERESALVDSRSSSPVNVASTSTPSRDSSKSTGRGSVERKSSLGARGRPNNKPVGIKKTKPSFEDALNYNY